MKHVLRDIIPPVLYRAASRLRRMLRESTTPGHGFEYGVEQPSEFYDWKYETREHWKAHYTDSPYYALWTVIADRVGRAGVERILDVGCGPGQVACLLRDIGVSHYTGLDFSAARIARASLVCPEYDFVCADVFENELLESQAYDCVLMMEFLEHVERDVDVLRRVQPGTTVLATVPNFRAAGHVRHFDSVEHVMRRYGPLLHHLDVTTILANERRQTYYVVQGTR